MFICPSCNSDASKLVTFDAGAKIGCFRCHTPQSRENVNLGQLCAKWTHVDKNGVEHKHRLTYGKDSEIKNRVLCPDDKRVVLNRQSGKEAQY